MSNAEEDDDFFADIYGEDEAKKTEEKKEEPKEPVSAPAAPTDPSSSEKPSDPRLQVEDDMSESKSAPPSVEPPKEALQESQEPQSQSQPSLPQQQQGQAGMPDANAMPSIPQMQAQMAQMAQMAGMPAPSNEAVAATMAAAAAAGGDRMGGITTGNIYIPPKDEGKMFIGGLNWETTDDSLRNYFGQYGEVVDCTVMRDNASGRSRGFGFLTFRDPQCVTEVLKKEHFLDGKIIDPKRAIPREEQDKTAKIFVGGVGSDVNEEDFKSFFDQYGTVIDAQLMMDKDTGRPRGFGFVTFDSDDAVETIVSEKFLMLKNKPIEVKRAEPRSKGGNDNQQQGQQHQQQQGQAANMGYGMNPTMMAQYMQQWQAYMAQMQQMMAMNPQGAQQQQMNPMMQQMYQQMGMQMPQQQDAGDDQQEEGYQNNEDNDGAPQYSAQEDDEGGSSNAAHDDRNPNAYRERFRNRYNRRDGGGHHGGGHNDNDGGRRSGSSNRRSRSPPANAPTGPRSGRGKGHRGGRGVYGRGGGGYHPYNR